MPGIEHSLQKVQGHAQQKCAAGKESRTTFPPKKIREDMVSILALLRTRAGVEFFVQLITGTLLQE